MRRMLELLLKVSKQVGHGLHAQLTQEGVVTPAVYAMCTLPSAQAAVQQHKPERHTFPSTSLHVVGMWLPVNPFLAEPVMWTCSELLLLPCLQRVSDILKDPSLLGTLDRQSCLQEWLVAAVQQQQQLLQHQLAQPQQHRHQQHRQQQKLQEQHRHREQQQLLLQGLEAASSPQGVAALLQRLQVDVVRCVHADSSYSPYCDMAKSLAGELQHPAAEASA